MVLHRLLVPPSKNVDKDKIFGGRLVCSFIVLYTNIRSGTRTVCKEIIQTEMIGLGLNDLNNMCVCVRKYQWLSRKVSIWWTTFHQTSTPLILSIFFAFFCADSGNADPRSFQLRKIRLLSRDFKKIFGKNRFFGFD